MLRIYCATSYHFRDINVSNNYLTKVGQGHRVELSQHCPSMENKKIYRLLHFCACSNRFKDINVGYQIVSLQKVGQGQEVKFSLTSLDGKYQRL